MRKLTRKTKMSFNLFIALVIIIIATLTYMLIIYVQKQPEKYVLKAGDIVYDETNSMIQMASDGQVEKKWDGKYYLQLDDGEKYVLGTHNVVYSKSEITVLGGGYRVFPDNSVSKISEVSKITDLNE